ATVFPQAIGLASSWSPELLQQVGAAVGDETRGFHHKDPSRCGLNVWAPVVNLLRDPRWGRNEEGYAEDPLLTGVLATAYADGLRRWSADSLLVVSDAQAPSNVVGVQHYYPDHVRSHAALVKAGVDSFTENDDRVGLTIERITGALERGQLDESDVDTAVRHI